MVAMLTLLAVVNVMYIILHKFLDICVYFTLVLPLRLLNKVFNGKAYKKSRNSSSKETVSKRLVIAKRGLKTKQAAWKRLQLHIIDLVTNYIAVGKSVLKFRRLSKSTVVDFIAGTKDTVFRTLRDCLSGCAVREFLCSMSHKMIDCNHLRPSPRFISLQRDISSAFAPFYLVPTSPGSDEEKEQDINGNPLELGQAKSASNKASSPEQYSRPMYEFEGRKGADERSRFPSNAEQFEPYTREQDPGIDPKEVRLREKKARKQKKKEGESVKAETIPGYQGDKSLDEVLNFIGDNKAMKSATTKNNNKKATPNGPTVAQSQAHSPPKETQSATIAPAATTPNKETKKTKKKQKNAGGNTTGAPLVANNIPKEDNSQDNASDGGSVHDVKEASPVHDIVIDSVKSVSSVQANTKKQSGSNSSTKQMDMKTKKSASSNNTNNARASATAKSDNKKDKEISTVLSNSESSDHYIFTDFDSNKTSQEEEFQTVKSSKKKKVPTATLR